MVLLVLLAFAGCTGRFGATSGWSGVALGEDVLYVGSIEAKLLVLDRETGDTKWSFPKDKEEADLVGIYGTPAVSEDLIYVGAYGEKNGTLYAVDINTQRARWDFPTDGHIVGSPLVVEDTVIVGSSDNFLYGLDANQGFEKWRFQALGEIWSTPVMHEDIIYFGSLDRNVYAVALKDTSNHNAGDLVWSFVTNGAVASTPLVTAGRVYIGSFDHKFYALDAGTGEAIWPAPFTADNWFWTKAISDGDTIYAGSLDGNLYALDADTGNPVWPEPFKTEGPIVSAPVLIPEGVVVASDDGSIYLVRMEDGREIRSFTTNDHIRAPLAASDSVVYFSGMDHFLRAADLSEGFWREMWCYNTKEEARGCD